MSSEEFLEPNYAKLESALRAIGYGFEVAVADIIDNSIDANAGEVLVRILTRRDGRMDLVIHDDGDGMSSDTLKEAMRFGSDVSDDVKRLGKFGLGLKLASLSQARQLTVISKHEGRLSARAWLEDGISRGFISSILDGTTAADKARHLVPSRPLKSSGTLVYWSDLYRTARHGTQSSEHAQKLIRRLQDHLSLAFHRFLQARSRPVSILLEVGELESGRMGIPVRLDPLDPFGYPHTGVKDFPVKLRLPEPYEKQLTVTAHIWPPNMKTAEYKLPGGTNARQGFYFYRNNRLIQGGGWNGLRETEPHASLARVEVDVSPDFDVDISLDVKKVEIQLPPPVAKAIEQSKAASGLDFPKYISTAVSAYRTKPVTLSELPLIPSRGLPADLIEFLRQELRLQSTAKHRDLKIEWRTLDESSFFDLDRDYGLLYLNSAFRRQLLHGLDGSSADLPVVKCLLFLLLRDAMTSERFGSKIRERAELINRILVRAVRHERVRE